MAGTPKSLGINPINPINLGINPPIFVVPNGGFPKCWDL